MHKRISRINAITPAEAMRRARSTLYEAGYRQHKFKLPASFVSQIDEIKTRQRMKGRDVVAGRMIREAMARGDVSSIELPPKPKANEPFCTVVLCLHEEEYRFLYEIRDQLRGVTLGVALEALLLRASNSNDNACSTQLEFNNRGSAVTR